MKYTDSSLTIISSELEPGAIRWKSPSNIALVKYWGKHGDQLPRNPSVSFTLSQAASDTTLFYKAREVDGQGVDIKVFLDEELHAGFTDRTRSYFEKLLPIYPFLKQMSFQVYTRNSFPHSAGIASSASGMSALALCLVSLEEKIFDHEFSEREMLRKSSYLARLGSGSASRSVFGKVAVWGKMGSIAGSSDEYAISIENTLHPSFENFHDDILIVSKNEKSISSRVGHELMDGNPYAQVRYNQAARRMEDMVSHLQSGDIRAFGDLLESEALTLHGMMMCSHPGYMLMEPNSLQIMQRVQRFRKANDCPVYFTLDAGPNVHLLYPDSSAELVTNFVLNELLYFCQDKTYLADCMGNGPERLEVNDVRLG